MQGARVGARPRTKPNHTKRGNKMAKATKTKVASFGVQLTDKQLSALGQKWGIENRVKGFNGGWQLAAIQMAHSIPSTHAQAVELAQRYTKLLNRAYDVAQWSPTPKAHFGKVNGGIGGFKPAYHPNLFATRTRTGFVWLCNAHGIRFSQCNIECLHGVAHGDSPTSKGKQTWLYLDVSKAGKPRGERKAQGEGKVPKVGKNTPTPSVERSTETNEAIKALSS